MDEPARKRRKTTSPPTEGPSSPLRKPPRRPSFASPTKASLARNYPNLVPSRPRSIGSPIRPRSSGNGLPRENQARVFAFGERDVQEALSQQAAQEDAMSAAQDATPRAHRANSVPVQSSVADEEESELPTTPPKKGLEDQEAPRGILFSSPSKRPPRMKSPAKQAPVQQSSSLLRQDEELDNEDAQEQSKEKQHLDVEVEKKKQEKARLERELAELESQVARCTEEITKEQQRSTVEALRPSDRSDLQDFISKISGADKAEDTMPVSSLLCSFLPFSVTTISKPQKREQERSIPSHRPVKLADPLPYLEMFTSFKISTHLSLPRGKVSSSRRAHQKHIIDIVGPQKLLTTQISITIDTQATEIIAMEIVNLSLWAESELGNFLRKRAQEKDLGNACWAIETYWVIAQKRVHYWNRCETAFAHLLAGQASDDSENMRPQAKRGVKMSRKDLNRHLGRDSIVLQDKHVLLKLNWRIDFDWTGEAESEVTAETAFPNAWMEADSKRALSKVPETFASLLQSRGAFEATRVITGLLFAQ